MDPWGPLLVSLGCVFLAGLVLDVVGRRTRLPRVTLQLMFGVAVGPSALDLLPDMTTAWFPAVSDMALVMIGFLLGGTLTRKALREHGRRVLGVSIVVVCTTFAVVGLGLAAIGAPPILALLLGAIATSTDPAASFDVVRETGLNTRFSRTLLAIVAIDDAWGLIVFGLAFAVALVLEGEGGAGVLVRASWELGGGVALGIALGLPMAYVTGRIQPGEPTLWEALGLVFLCGGLAIWLGVSFLIASMSLGATVTNLARHHTRPFHAIEGIEWPFLILFFVLSGAALDLQALWGAGGWLAAYLGFRVVGRLAGGWLGGRAVGADGGTRRWIGMALLPQAGVALGMALVATRRLPEIGADILPIVVASTVLFELLGPLATRVALERVET
ncbi:MAG: cation:proton antiporter [Myxococcales bacterium]|nr:cation:proton antiporter [Myxococcales bacterium]